MYKISISYSKPNRAIRLREVDKLLVFLQFFLYNVIDKRKGEGKIILKKSARAYEKNKKADEDRGVSKCSADAPGVQ